jgi:hypothetical protein
VPVRQPSSGALPTAGDALNGQRSERGTWRRHRGPHPLRPCQVPLAASAWWHVRTGRHPRRDSRGPSARGGRPRPGLQR